MDPEYINRELSHYDEEERDARSVYPTGLSASLLLVFYGGVFTIGAALATNFVTDSSARIALIAVALSAGLATIVTVVLNTLGSARGHQTTRGPPSLDHGPPSRVPGIHPIGVTPWHTETSSRKAPTCAPTWLNRGSPASKSMLSWSR